MAGYMSDGTRAWSGDYSRTSLWTREEQQGEGAGHGAKDSVILPGFEMNVITGCVHILLLKCAWRCGSANLVCMGVNSL